MVTAEFAKDNLRSRLIEPAHGQVETWIRPIFVLRVASVKGSTSIRVKYFIAPGGPMADALQDITGRVASALSCFHKYNDKTGTFLVKGGTGDDAINSLSLELFGDHQAIPVWRV